MANPIAPSNSTYLQGSQILVMDSRIEVSDRLGNIVNRFPVSDFAAIADNGEFYFKVSLDTNNPTYVFDESLVGFSGDTPQQDIDLVVIVPDGPLGVVLGYGVNAYTPTVLPPINDVFVWKGNCPYDVSLEDGFYRRVLPMKLYLPIGLASTSAEVYFAKFSTV